MPKMAPKGKNSSHPLRGSISKKNNRFVRKSVKKMLVMMSSTQEQPSTSSDQSTSSNPNTHNIEDFLSTGRTGRRNALPDILSEHNLITSSELPIKLESLTTNDKESDPNKPSTSKQIDNVR